MVRILLIVLTLIFTVAFAEADIYKYESSDGVVYFTNTPSNTDYKVVMTDKRVPASPKTAAKSRSAFRSNYHDIVEEKARQHNIDPELVKAVIKAESNWNSRAISPKGALGLMQLMPSTANDLGVNNPFDPEENIDGGIRYLRYLLERFNGDLTLALAAYNAGPRRVERKRAIPAIPETVAYVKKVVSHYSGNKGTRATAPVLTAPKIKEKIHKIFLADGTVLFTNSQISAASYQEH